MLSSDPAAAEARLRTLALAPAYAGEFAGGPAPAAPAPAKAPG